MSARSQKSSQAYVQLEHAGLAYIVCMYVYIYACRYGSGSRLHYGSCVAPHIRLHLRHDAQLCV